MALANHALMKSLNRARVLNALRHHAPMSHSDLAKRAFLTKKSIKVFVNELLDEGLVIRTGKRRIPRGRPHTLFELCPDAVTAMGIHIAPGCAEGILVDLTGNIVAVERDAYGYGSDADRIFAGVEAVYSSLMPRTQGNLSGVGIGVPGPFNPRAETLRHSADLPALNEVPLRERMGFIEKPFLFEHKSRAKALAEKWFGIGQDMQNFVCVDLDIGIGAGVIIERKLYAGARNIAGEIGHLVVEPGGLPCRCGNRGCLESYLSERVLVKRINRESGTKVCRLHEVKLTPVVRNILEQSGNYLARAVAALANPLDPTAIILNGGLMCFGDIVLPSIQREVAHFYPSSEHSQPKVLASRLKNASALGAASHFLSHVFEVEQHYYV